MISQAEWSQKVVADLVQKQTQSWEIWMNVTTPQKPVKNLLIEKLQEVVETKSDDYVIAYVNRCLGLGG